MKKRHSPVIIFFLSLPGLAESLLHLAKKRSAVGLIPEKQPKSALQRPPDTFETFHSSDFVRLFR